uniref:FKBP prolyl isomerase family member 6 (inactive) n=1 Tax=Naja naja TaxID=35670 RepID=A0A8C6VC82_NAJNA
KYIWTHNVGFLDSYPYVHSSKSYQWLGHRMQNITSDKGVLKEIIRDGSGETVPPDSSVLVKFSGYLEHTDRPFDTNWFKKNPKLMKLGEGDNRIGDST